MMDGWDAIVEVCRTAVLDSASETPTKTYTEMEINVAVIVLALNNKLNEILKKFP